MLGKGISLLSRILIVLCLLSCSLWLASLDASQIPSRPQLPQGPPPGDFDLVLSYVTVSAAKNATVPRLSTEDFHIFEDGKEQKSDYFLVQNQPVSIGIVWGAGTGFVRRMCGRT